MLTRYRHATAFSRNMLRRDMKRGRAGGERNALLMDKRKNSKVAGIVYCNSVEIW